MDCVLGKEHGYKQSGKGNFRVKGYNPANTKQLQFWFWKFLWGIYSTLGRECGRVYRIKWYYFLDPPLSQKRKAWSGRGPFFAKTEMGERERMGVFVRERAHKKARSGKT